MQPPPSAESVRRELAERGLSIDSFEPLAGDVSRRLYFRARMRGGGTVVVAIYPEDLAGACRRFAISGRLLGEAGVPAPRILAVDCDAGWMMVEDLGSQTLFDRYSGLAEPWQALLPYYRGAIRLADRIASIPRREVAALNPPLDGSLLRGELQQTWEAYLGPRGLTRSRGVGRLLARALEALCEALGGEGSVVCHRDFMLRNLMPRRGVSGAPFVEPVVLDHQDLRLGPPLYDLASLLNDSLFPPHAVVEELLEARSLGPAGWLSYHRAAVQRTLKAVGTFARHGSERHRALIAPTLRRACEHLSRLPEAAGVDAERIAALSAQDDFQSPERRPRGSARLKP